MTGDDLAGIMPDVARQLWGEPNGARSTRTELRWGTNGARSVDLTKGVWFDFEAKEGGGVLDLIKRERTADPWEWLREHGYDNDADHGSKRRKMVATYYDYTDESGALLFQVCRLDPKDFHQRRRPRPDDEPDKVKDGWVWNVKDVRRVPYRLPELLEAVALGRPVFVVEGEKDCDTLANHGIVATTNAGGAGKWKADFAGYFRNADVIVIPDNDDAGRNHVNDVARPLVGSVARIRLLELPGLPPKGDVTDWFAKGGTVEAFNELVNNAPDWTDDGSEPAVHATPWQWIDPQTLPPRSWLYGHHIIRKFVSATVAPGGTGKSSLIVAEVLEMVSGKPLLLTGKTHAPLRVWYCNLEDPRDEIERRIAAGCIAYRLQPDDLAGRLFVDSGRDQPCVIARYDGRRRVVIDDTLVAGLIEEVRRRQIDVLEIDPFKRTHELDENDNTAVDLVVQQLARIADEGNCAVSLVHHTRKSGGAEITAESSRGSKSLVDGCRAVRVLNVMTKGEAENAGVTDDPRRYFRTYPDKLNLAPPPDSSEWCRLESIHLGNAPDGLGDNVGVAMPWTWPDAFAGVTVATLQAVQGRIEGGAWREDTRAQAWAGKAVAEVLKLDLDRKRDRARVLTLLKIWIKNGALKVVERPDGHRKPKKFVEVGEWAS